jgi:hypothetical protein
MKDLQLTLEQATLAGKEIAGLLGLKKDKKSGFYKTDWGTKNDAGLARSILRILVENANKSE